MPFPVSAALPLLGPPSSPPLALFDLLLPHFDVLRLRELPALARAALKALAISAESVRPALEAPQGGGGPASFAGTGFPLRSAPGPLPRNRLPLSRLNGAR